MKTVLLGFFILFCATIFTIWFGKWLQKFLTHISVQKVMIGMILLGVILGTLTTYIMIAYIPASREYLTPMQYQCNISHNCTR